MLINQLQVKSLSQMAPRVTKKQKLFRRETPKTPRFTEKISATLGDLGEVRRINIFM